MYQVNPRIANPTHPVHDRDLISGNNMLSLRRPKNSLRLLEVSYAVQWHLYSNAECAQMCALSTERY